MRTVLLSLCVALTGVMLCDVASAAQIVTLERDSPLYSEPRLDSPPVTRLKLGSTGEVLGKQNGWLNLKTPDGTGWLFSFNVRFPVQKAESGEPSSGLGRLFGPRRTVGVTSTIGIRGLDEEDLKQANFNAGQMKQLDGYAATKQAAEEGARASGLAPVKVEYLDANK